MVNFFALILLAVCQTMPHQSSGDALVGDRTTVADIRRNINAWDGKTVQVEGWLGYCADYQCAIFDTELDARSDSLDAWDRGLSIGDSPAFDAKAVKLQFSRVLLKAEVNNDCFQNFCTDRADLLRPIEIGVWTEAHLKSSEKAD